MTYASVLARQQQKLDVCLVIDGIPILFGTRSGRVHSGSGVTNPPSAPWTSYASIVPGSIKLGKRELDMDSCFVKPAKVSLQLSMSTTWNKYFEPRRQPQTFLGEDLTAAGTTIKIVKTSNFSNGQYAYINRETVLFGTVNALPTGVTGCTRNCIALPGTNASAYSGTDTTVVLTPGYITNVTSFPQYMSGRPASLRIFAGEDDTNFTDITGLRLSSSPSFNLDTGTIDLTFDDGMSYFARKLNTGMRGYSYAAVSDLFFGGGEWGYRFALPNPYEFTSGTSALYAMLSMPDHGPFICKIEALGGGPLYNIDIKKSAFQMRDWTPSSEALAGASLKRVAVFSEYPMQALLQVLLSRLGDGANDATYDVLPGRLWATTNPPVDGSYEFCMGAGIPSSLVDVTTLKTYANRRVSGWAYVLGARGEESLLDLLEEIGWALGGVFFINSSGKLSFKPWLALHTSDAVASTLTEDHILRMSPLKSQLDESQIVHTITYQCNIRPWEETPQRFVTVVHQPVKNLYSETPNGVLGSRTIKRRTMWCTDTFGASKFLPGNVRPPFTSETDIRDSLNRIFAKRAKGIRRYQVILPWRYSTVTPGDRVTVSHSLLNAFDGSTLSAVTFDVTAVELSYAECTVTLDIDEVPPGVLFAPTLRVASYAANTPGAGQSTFTLSTSNATWGGGIAPSAYFQTGWQFLVRDRSSTPMFTTTSTMTITGGNGIDTLVCNSNAGFAVVAGDVITFRDYDNAAQTNVNQAQLSAQHDYAFMAGDALSLGAASDAAQKWG